VRVVRVASGIDFAAPYLCGMDQSGRNCGTPAGKTQSGRRLKTGASADDRANISRIQKKVRLGGQPNYAHLFNYKNSEHCNDVVDSGGDAYG
jgi:hypothetical protein